MTKWTDAQARAIYEPSGQGNILVSAAAGSGKTAVLVERIADMAASGDASIDELLVVTFTEAAAAEMKERIMKRINEFYRNAVSNGDTEMASRLREQLHLTSTADINTIDSFCLNVVKNNFHILGIDPNFSIMDKSEGDMLIDDTLDEMFLSLYACEEEPVKKRFERLVGMYASNRDDEGLKKIVRKVYGFIQSFAEPVNWLHEKADMYAEDMTESIWMKSVILEEKKNYIVKRNKNVWNDMISRMLIIAERWSGRAFEETEAPSLIQEASDFWGKKLWKSACACLDAVKALEKAQTWEEVYNFYKFFIEKKSYLGNAINKMPADKAADDSLWSEYYEQYNDMRTLFRNECLKLPSRSKDDFNSYVHSDELKQTVDDIVWITELFCEWYDEKKSKKNVKSFSDIEHLAYRLFSENKNIREEYAQRYTEILIDEFQDTNGLQDAIFTLISRGNKNMFMVGDLKQSIYRFRGGDPTIFKDKSRSYRNKKQDGKIISLSQNFRSRAEVINSVNSLFGSVMSDEVGDVLYTGDEMLNREPERECYCDGDNLQNPLNRKMGYNSQLYRIAVIQEDEKTDENITAAKAEAAFIADKIRELVNGHFQVYAGDGKYRDIEYRDIVILMRATKSSGLIVRDVLESHRVPAFVQKEEYFERREIKLMLSLISLINNHIQDIPLVAVMRSPIGGFTENELAEIKTEYKGRSFYKAVKSYQYGENNKGKKLQRKCARFIANLDRWRSYVKMKSIASLIWTLYEETGFYDFMGALEGGEEAQANLKLLYERAKKYEASGFKGIFNFIRYIERMESRSEDIGGAKLVNENHNVVRIMTIHKSKGLEFPIVFLARTSGKFAFTHSGEENRIMLHKDAGIGIDYYNYDDMYCKKLMFNEYIGDANKREYLSEEMRLLYVAATRAKEKLIVTAAKNYKTYEDYELQKASWHEKYSGKPISARVAETAKSYADWIIPAVESGGEYWTCEDVEMYSADYAEAEQSDKKELKIENMDEVRSAVRKILEFKYAYPFSGQIPAKTSVTAIKEMEDMEHIHEDDPIYMTRKPSFMREEKMGAQIGTAHHQLMAYIDIEQMKTIDEKEYEIFVNDELARIVQDGQIDSDIADDTEIIEMICSNVCGFFRSDMGKKVFDAKKIYREKPFEIEISACEYDTSLDVGYENEKVVVQGIIDLYFEDNNGDIILVDYKTDRCKTENEQREIAKRYEKQLDLYERAMEKILKKSVKDKYLYLFSAQSVVKL